MADPTIPNREELRGALGADPRIIQAFEDLFYLIPDKLDSGINVLIEAQFNAVFPALNVLGGRLAEVFKRLDQEIQFENSDYVLLLNDSGVEMDTTSGFLNATMPNAVFWKNENKFVTNVGSNTLYVKLEGGQTVSGVDLVIVYPDLPFAAVNFKSDGQNCILLSDRQDSKVLGGNYWTDESGNRITDEAGNEIVFAI